MIYDVLEYGAKADGVTNDAAAIQKAIDECSAAGGGQVVLRSGRTYYSSSIIIKPYVDLHLERGSILKAHSDLKTYFHPNEGQKDNGVRLRNTSNIKAIICFYLCEGCRPYGNHRRWRY